MKADICGSETLAKKSAARGHPGLNQGPLDLQSNALPLSYIPCCQKEEKTATYSFKLTSFVSGIKQSGRVNLSAVIV